MRRCPICQRAVEEDAVQCPGCKYRFPPPKEEASGSDSFCLRAGVNGVVWFAFNGFMNVALTVQVLNCCLAPLLILGYGWLCRGDYRLVERSVMFPWFIFAVWGLEVYPLGRIGARLLRQRESGEVRDSVWAEDRKEAKGGEKPEIGRPLDQQPDRRTGRRKPQLHGPLFWCLLVAFSSLTLIFFCGAFARAAFLYFAYNW